VPGLIRSQDTSRAPSQESDRRGSPRKAFLVLLRRGETLGSISLHLFSVPHQSRCSTVHLLAWLPFPSRPQLSGSCPVLVRFPFSTSLRTANPAKTKTHTAPANSDTHSIRSLCAQRSAHQSDRISIPLLFSLGSFPSDLGPVPLSPSFEPTIAHTPPSSSFPHPLPSSDWFTPKPRQHLFLHFFLIPRTNTRPPSPVSPER